jgi:hypothetical protein
VRTTITLDEDADSIVRRLMRDRGLTFKQAVNEAIRRGASTPPARTARRTRTFRMGEPRVDIDKALRLAADLEDDDIIRKLALRK